MVKPCLSCEDQFEPASGLNYAKYLRMRQVSSADTFPTSSDSPGLTKASPLPSHTVAESTGHGWSVPFRIRVVPDPAPPPDHDTRPVAGPIPAHTECQASLPALALALAIPHVMRLLKTRALPPSGRRAPHASEGGGARPTHIASPAMHAAGSNMGQSQS